MISSLDVMEWVKASHCAERSALPHNGIFNQDDPDLSTCGLADILAESDYPPATSEDIKDLFPELEGLLELNPVDFAFDLPNKVDEVCQQQSPSAYVSEVELSPTEPINGLQHFFDSYMDLSDLLSSITNEEVSPTLAETVSSKTAESTENDISTTTTTTIVDTEACSSNVSNISSPNTDQKLGRKRHLTSSTSSTTDDEGTEEDGNYFKYRKRRDKNNVASRRSRENRKQREKGMEEKAEFLVTENERLRQKIEELTQLATEMRARLVESIAKK